MRKIFILWQSGCNKKYKKWDRNYLFVKFYIDDGVWGFKIMGNNKSPNTRRFFAG